ncbi:Polyketide synthase, enoylreductase [Penicillium occitanis (nom. inval.)]|nr:Polyketide synthase, enoylreductase [Penicillium occitanis (nom. inval.)]PCG88340.1 hypothetical protein PENOC_111430 [Penicillium occitanis (nom. inval.)]
MKAVLYKEPNQAVLVSDRPIPKPRDGYLLIKTQAIALNPTDWKHVDVPMAKDGCVLGVDFTGIVEEVGPNVTKSFQKGDRVAGYAHGGNLYNEEDGSFAEYIVAKEFNVLKVPDILSIEEAATIGTGVATVGQGLYEENYGLELALPTEPVKEPEFVLISGGSTATGTLGIQFASLSGYKVITTASPKNFDLVKSYGALEVFDYKDPDCGKKINDYTKNKLRYAWDCVSIDETAQICADALTTGPGARYGCILTPDFPRKDVKYTFTLAYTGTGHEVDKVIWKFQNNKRHGLFQMLWFEIARTFLATGRVKTHPISVKPGGLKGAIDGMETMRAGNYSAEKLVYRISETP